MGGVLDGANKTQSGSVRDFLLFQWGVSMLSRANRRSGFTLVEVLIVVVIMAVLAATIIPQFSTSTMDAKVSTAKFNLNSIRSQLQLYKAQHNGTFPATLSLMTIATTNTGATGSGANLGPYLQAIPEEPFSASATVATSLASDSTFTTGIGWYYNASTGEIRINSTFDPDASGTTYLPLNQW